MKKPISIALAALMIASLTACGGGSGSSSGSSDAAPATSGDAAASTSEAGGKKLTLWAWDANFNIPAMQAAADDYKANVDPEFELEIVTQAQSSDVENAITTSNGDYSLLPDITLFQDHYADSYIRSYPGVFIPVDDAGVNWDDFGQEKLSYSVVDGQHYGFPVDAGTAIMAYRVDLLEQCGYSMADMTGCSWDKFIEVGEKVYAETGKYLVSMDGDGNDLIYMMMQAEGVSQFNDDGTPNFAANDTLKAVVGKIVEMSQKKVLFLANGWSDYCDQTITGDQVAGVLNGNWIIPTMKTCEANAGKWEITSLPTLNGGEGYASNGGSSLYITGNCQNTELAKAFLAYTFGGSTVTYDGALKNGGVVTCCLSAGQSDVYNEGVEFFNNTPIYAQIAEMTGHVPTVAQSTYHYSARKYLATAIVNIINGADLDAEIQNAEDQLKFEMGI